MSARRRKPSAANMASAGKRYKSIGRYPGMGESGRAEAGKEKPIRGLERGDPISKERPRGERD